MSGHPARKDPAVDKLFKTMRASVELVRDLDLPPNAMLELKAAALGLMSAYSAATGLPHPYTVKDTK